jgi:predicted nucleic acid-binding protein
LYLVNLVIDTSVLIAVLVSEPERDRIVDLTAGADLIAPGSVHWEVGNALAAMLKRKRITAQQALAVLRAYDQIPIRFVDVDLTAALEVAAEHDLYAYDAYVIHCAAMNHCALVSLDKGLLYAAKRAHVKTMEVPT